MEFYNIYITRDNCCICKVKVMVMVRPYRSNSPCSVAALHSDWFSGHVVMEAGFFSEPEMTQFLTLNVPEADGNVCM